MDQKLGVINAPKKYCYCCQAYIQKIRNYTLYNKEVIICKRCKSLLLNKESQEKNMKCVSMAIKLTFKDQFKQLDVRYNKCEQCNQRKMLYKSSFDCNHFKCWVCIRQQIVPNIVKPKCKVPFCRKEYNIYITAQFMKDNTQQTFLIPYICKNKCVNTFFVDLTTGLSDGQSLSVNGNNIKCLICKKNWCQVCSLSHPNQPHCDSDRLLKKFLKTQQMMFCCHCQQRYIVPYDCMTNRQFLPCPTCDGKTCKKCYKPPTLFPQSKTMKDCYFCLKKYYSFKSRFKRGSQFAAISVVTVSCILESALFFGTGMFYTLVNLRQTSNIIALYYQKVGKDMKYTPLKILLQLSLFIPEYVLNYYQCVLTGYQKVFGKQFEILRYLYRLIRY